MKRLCNTRVGKTSSLLQSCQDAAAFLHVGAVAYAQTVEDAGGADA